MSLKVYDKKGRWRNKYVGFRVSPEEDEQLEIAVALTGLTKQDYILRKLQDKDIIVVGNPRVHKALRNHLINVLEELQRIESGNAIDDELLHTIQLITITMGGLKNELGAGAPVGTPGELSC